MLKHDETVQRQSFDQAYKNFWSYVDFNIEINANSLENQRSDSGEFNKTNTSNKSTKNQKTSLSYQEARQKANELLMSSK
jgi:hypothetical protein